MTVPKNQTRTAAPMATVTKQANAGGKIGARQDVKHTIAENR